MIGHILAAITIWVTHVISSLGYGGVAFLMAIESAAIPLPSEIIMPFAGYLVISGRFTLIGLALAGALGSTVGSLVTYYLGYFGGRKLIEKYGHIVLISEKELAFTENFFQRFRLSSVFIGRLLPVIRTFISVPAAIARVPIGIFTVSAFVGSFIWSYFLAWLGLKLGENWRHLEVYFHRFDLLILALILVAGAIWLYRYFKRS